MYVDGDLAPRSNTNMPRQNSILKCHVKIRQKTCMRPTGIKNLSSIPPYEMYPAISIINISEIFSLCRSSKSCLSEHYPRKRAKRKNTHLTKTKQRTRKPRKRHEFFHNSNGYPDIRKNTSLKSSTSQTYSSASLYVADIVRILQDNLYSSDGTTFWWTEKSNEQKKEPFLPYHRIFRLSNSFHDYIGICPKFRSRYHFCRWKLIFKNDHFKIVFSNSNQYIFNLRRNE